MQTMNMKKKFSLVLILGTFLTTFVWAQNTSFRPVRYDYREGEFDQAGNLIKKGEISKLIEKSFAEARAALDEIAQLPNEIRNFKNTVEAMELAYARLLRTIEPIIFMKDVSENLLLRQEATLYEKKAKEFMIEMTLRKDLYQAFEAFRKNMKNDFSSLDASDRRLIEIMSKDFRQSGVWLEGDKFERFRALKNELAGLETEFRQNLNENKDKVLFAAEELEGVPEWLRKDLKQAEGGRYVVPVKPDYYVPMMENATRSETRKRMYMAWVSREAPRNIHILERAIEIRTELAHLLGYSTWMDYRTDGRMAQNAETVRVFLESLRGKLAQKAQEDLGALVALKREMTGDQTASSIEMWEKDYYANQLKKRLFSFDPEEVREYFPASRVVEGTLKIYSNLFGVIFQEVEKPDVWSEGVRLFDVLDTKSGNHLGWFFMDLFPREGKYDHFAAFGLVQAGIATADGTYQRPLAGIVANFNRPSADRPSILSHGEVETFFHEAGHILNDLLTKARYASYSGNNLARDFVEAPSQMLENWVWRPEVLDVLSGHYKDETKKLPENLRRGLLASAQFNTGVLYSRQLFYATLDYILHTQAPKDILALATRLAKELTGIALPPGGEQFLASFGHLVGYDGGYYGYLYSEVFAQFMWEGFEREGIFNAETGMRYRRAVQEHGGDRPEMESIREFRGSDPTPDAFFRKIGISGQTTSISKGPLGETLAKLEEMGRVRSGEKPPVFSDTELRRLSDTMAREYVAWVESQREKGARFRCEDGFRETAGYVVSRELADAMLKEGLLRKLQGLTGQRLTVPKVSETIFGEFRRTIRR
ncbi:MAG: Zn-dependent oligopeptidase [Deltaproteobacteria bacterium]|nr:Zn-dependent oligopeptidase [Deltaproteobacteria bacterium]